MRKSHKQSWDKFFKTSVNKNTNSIQRKGSIIKKIIGKKWFIETENKINDIEDQIHHTCG